MDGFKTFPPEPVVVTLSGTALELTPIRLGELPRLLAVVPIGAYRQQAARVHRVAMVPAFAPSTVVMLTPKGVAPELPVVSLWREAFVRAASSEALHLSDQL